MFNKTRKNEKGFTLVEVIVVAVIVAVLALVGIQLYQGYAVEARRNTAENLAASAASYLQTFVNARGEGFVTAANFANLVGTDSTNWKQPLNPSVAAGTTTDSSCVAFTCPATGEVDRNEDGTVVARVNGVRSRGVYRWK
jgi:prepilin-type N-terminal cleavage/methylation domain-containing protein